MKIELNRIKINIFFVHHAELNPGFFCFETTLLVCCTTSSRYLNVVRLAYLSVEGGLLGCCLQRRVPRRLLELDPFQCSVECGWSGSFYRLGHYKTDMGR